MAHPSLSLGRVLLYPHGYFFNRLAHFPTNTFLVYLPYDHAPYLSALPGFSIFRFAFMPWPLEFQAVTSSSLQPPLNHNLQTLHKSLRDVILEKMNPVQKNQNMEIWRQIWLITKKLWWSLEDIRIYVYILKKVLLPLKGEVNNSGYATVTYKSSIVWVDRVKNFKKLI